MSKLFIIVIILVAVILGIVALATQSKSSPGINLDLPLQNPTAPPLATPTGGLITPTSAASLNVAETNWVKNASSAAIKTARGEIVVQLYAQDTPKTVTNFATLAKIGYYNNLTFHRVEDWVIQGGDPNGNGTGGTSIYGQTFEDELNPNTPSYKEGYKEGVLAMANRGPNTNGSQFFILTKDYPLDHAYTIFGKVTSGMDVVKQIKQGDKILTITVQ